MEITDGTATVDIMLIDQYGYDRTGICLSGMLEYDKNGACIVNDLGDTYEWFTDLVSHTGDFKDVTKYNGYKLYLDGELVTEEKEMDYGNR